MDISGCRNEDKVRLSGDAFSDWNSGKSKVAGMGHSAWEDGCQGDGSAHRERREFGSEGWLSLGI